MQLLQCEYPIVRQWAAVHRQSAGLVNSDQMLVDVEEWQCHGVPIVACRQEVGGWRMWGIRAMVSVMSLRTRILLFLFIFALVPLLMAVVINLPLVLERVDSFYRQSFLQNLRQDFRDLDQHLASRDANVRLLARLPESCLLYTSDAADES